MHATKANAWNEERLAVHILQGYTEWAKKKYEITKAYLSAMALRDAVFFAAPLILSFSGLLWCNTV